MRIIPLILVLTIAILSASASICFCQEKSENTYIMVFLTPILNKDIGDDEKQIIENEHFRNMSRLSDNKILANAGPFEDGGEIMILNLNNPKEAETILQNDPLVVQNLTKFEILSIQFRYGGICDPVFPYEMKTYGFIRYIPSNQIASYKTNSDFEMKRQHERFLKELKATGQVILEGIFGGNDGGILIYEGNSGKLNLQLDPAITEGYLIGESQTIWLNKGSFCED